MTLIHFQNARLIDPETLDDSIGTLTVKGGIVIAKNGAAPSGAELIDCGGKCLAPGIVDLGVKVSEPGERHKESFRSAGLFGPECGRRTARASDPGAFGRADHSAQERPAAPADSRHLR